MILIFCLLPTKCPETSLIITIHLRLNFIGKFDLLLCHLCANNPCLYGHEVDVLLLALNRSSGFC